MKKGIDWDKDIIPGHFFESPNPDFEKFGYSNKIECDFKKFNFEFSHN
jgi:hypothetical protein